MSNQGMDWYCIGACRQGNSECSDRNDGGHFELIIRQQYRTMDPKIESGTQAAKRPAAFVVQSWCCNLCLLMI